MNCPKCDTRLKKDMPVCSKCGFRVAELENVSNFKARKVLRSGTLLEKEDIFYVNKVPKDLVKKDLILFTIFAGLFGGHNFYVGRIVLGISKIISLIIGVILSIVVYNTGAMQIYSLTGLFLAYPIVTWLYDIVRVVLGRYPIPVMLDN